MAAAVVGFAMSFGGGAAFADSVVFANRTEEPVAFAVLREGKLLERLQLEPADVVSVAFAAGSVVRFLQGEAPVEYALAPNSATFFYQRMAGSKRVLELQQIGLAGAADDPAPAPASPPNASDAAMRPEPPVKITVKLLVDDEERASQRGWESRLRKRLAEASRILQRQARVSFEVAAVGSWDSDDDNQDFVTALGEFEAEVQSAPARLAIGFTSQYALVQGRTNLGGTRGALRSHILLREWSQHHSEPERLELLVHELGHFLGAAHSPEPISVMRPVLGDQQALARRFRICFDPLNALAMSLVGDGLRTAPIQQLSKLPMPLRRRLSEVYLTLTRSLPEDPAARHYLHWIAGGTLPALPAPALHTEDQTAEPTPVESDTDSTSLTAGARRVVAAIVGAAQRNAALPPGMDDAQPGRLVGDALTELYVRTAAEEALRFRETTSNAALLLGLGVALDTSDLLRTNAVTAEMWRAIETDAERAERLAVLGLPTMRDRADLTQHFFVSAALTTATSSTVAEAAGLAKELKDMQGASGFSFSDLSADLAGIALATRLAEAEEPVRRLVDFRVSNYLPPPAGLPDGLSAEEFADAFGSVVDSRFRDRLAEMRRQIEALPSQRRQ